MIKRIQFNKLKQYLLEPRKFIQVLAGPRQVGKTTLVQQVMEDLPFPSHYASADEPSLKDAHWIETQWSIAQLRAKESQDQSAVLVLDELQKITNWSETIKRLWDQDTKAKRNLKLVILGSSKLLIQNGLTESLAGRFELIPISHWTFEECRSAFGWDIDQYIYFGGYPGAADLIKDEERWANYVREALIETTIAKDILLITQVNKPALLRKVFELGCLYSGQILSYQKMLGQLHEAGNATTLAHYLDLLSGAGMLTGLQKFSTESIRQKASSPKLQVLNTALLSAQNIYSFKSARQDPEYWGRLVESAIGAHLINSTQSTRINVWYWRDGNKEVDFILQLGDQITALEVKSTKRKTSLPGIAEFSKRAHPKHVYLIGGQGVPLEEFFLSHPERWI